MILNDFQVSTRKKGYGEIRNLVIAAGFIFLAAWSAPGAQTQQRTNNPQATSDLALQNLSRVAASAAEIKTILLKDAGLMVELKHTVAKEATDHGQIVSDSD